MIDKETAAPPTLTASRSLRVFDRLNVEKSDRTIVDPLRSTAGQAH